MSTDRRAHQRHTLSESGRHWVGADGTRYPRTPETDDTTCTKSMRVEAYVDAPEDRTGRLPHLTEEQMDAIWREKFLTPPPKPRRARFFWLAGWIVAALGVALAIAAVVWAVRS